MMDEASRRQIEAANPNQSTWVSANAGSGKTRVLTDRVARLLLEGVDPRNILCLTYTKAAASEMQNRLFKRLGEWAMMDDGRLSSELTKMGAMDPTEGRDLNHARTLFATAIETPGGLRIQTIHSFCSSILRRFPLEAGVSPQFTEMEDRAAELLRIEVLETLSKGAGASAIDALARYVHDDQLLSVTKEIVSNKAEFEKPRTDRDIAALYNITPEFTQQDAINHAIDGNASHLIELIDQAARSASASYQKDAALLKTVNTDSPTLDDLEKLSKPFLYAKTYASKAGKYPQPRHKAAVEAFAPIIDELNEWMDRIAEAYQLLNAVHGYHRTKVIYDFANVFIPAYEKRKQDSGLLDFDDLIEKARKLLTDEAVANWVLFKLDGGIEHILVDEAQDTSPSQWDVISALSEEFAAGEGAFADRQRTIFVVGDKKQSIYSFQGAAPDEFDRKRTYFGDALARSSSPLQVTELQHSFRSSNAILSLVDQTFVGELADGLEKEVRHVAFKSELPGRVDLWPVVPKPDKDEPENWYDPVDMPSAENEDVVLAKKVAAEIKRITETETIPAELDGKPIRRPVEPGDFLILVQRRKSLFYEIIRACKALGLDVAGADRLKLTQQLAVKDILSLLKFLALNEDDLSLAEALRSPLIGWTEKQLFQLAHYREKPFLWEALRKNEHAYGETLDFLNDLRNRADYLRPYELIERILTHHDGRRKLVYQLGIEAEDPIDALLSQALAYERSSVPSLTGFIHWIEGDDVEVKRQMDTASNQIRVMSVHGSKGLEAPIVILPETTTIQNSFKSELVKTPNGPLWKQGKDNMAPSARGHLDDALASQLREKRRLLYVAMTRAEKWLIVFGAGEVKPDTEAWYDLIEQGMQRAGATSVTINGEDVLRYSHGDWEGLDVIERPAPAKTETIAPEYAPISVIPERPKTLSPSDLGGAKALPGEVIDGEEEVALARGTLIHTLLEHLPLYPAAERESVGNALMVSDEDSLIVPDRHKHLENVMHMIENKNLSMIFAAGTLSEVSITADIPQFGGQRIHGSIDRLIIENDRVLCIDFKSNGIVPGSADRVPEGILRQLGAYHAALSQIYPNRRIDLGILWTAEQTLMDIDPKLAIEALERAGRA